MINFMVFMIILFAMGMTVYRIAGRYTSMKWSEVWTMDSLKYIPLIFLVMLVVVKPTVVDPLLGWIAAAHKWIMTNILQVSNADPYFGLLTITIVFVFFVYAGYRLILGVMSFVTGADQAKVRLTAKIISAAMFSASGLHLLKGSVDFVTYVLTVSVITFAILLLTVIASWRGKLQEKYGLAVGYLCNIFMFWLLCWINSGLDIYRNITGSIAVALPFLLFNFAVVVVLDKFFDPEISMRKKLAYKTNYVGTVILSGVFLVMTITLISGNVNRYDLLTAHTNNQTIKAMEDIEKRQKFSQEVNGMNYLELQAKKEAAIQRDDLDTLMMIKKSNDKFTADVEDVQLRGELRYVFIGGFEELYKDSKNLLKKAWNRKEEAAAATAKDVPILTAEERLQKALKEYTALWGPPKPVVLNKEGWVEIARVKAGDRVHYLSLESFLLKDEKSSGTYKAAIEKKYGTRFQRRDMVGSDTPVWLSKNEKPTTAYVWVERKNKKQT